MTTVKSLLATSCVKITFETGMEAILNTHKQIAWQKNIPSIKNFPWKHIHVYYTKL